MLKKLLINKNSAGIIILFILIGLAPFSWAQGTDPEDKAAEAFFYRCAGCHTIGEGARNGPDLINSSKWNDSDLGVAIKKMEKNTGPLSESDILQLIEFLKDISVSGRIAKQKERIEAKFRAELPPPSFEIGQKLFNGEKPLTNGGPACFTCHHFVNAGGTLGPDLSSIKDRSTGTVLQSAVENANFKIMRPIYEKHKITKEESLHISEFLSHPEKNNNRHEITLNKILSLSAVGISGYFILLWFLNKQRKGRTREKLIQKSKRGNLS